MTATWRILHGDCREILRTLPEESVQCCVTSPPYWGLRDYGHEGQLGLEATVADYVGNMVEVFRGVRRVLRSDGTLWLNLGDCYAASADVASGLKQKDLVGVPWRVAFALQADGWWLRSDIVWSKPNLMPESIRDRPTKAHEYVFLLTKSERYFYDAEAIRDPCTEPADNGSRRGPAGRSPERPRATRNARTVWDVRTQPFKGAHIAVMPPALAERCVLAGTSERGACASCGAPWERVLERPERPLVANAKVRRNTRDGGITAEDGIERTGLSHFKYNEWLRENPPRTVGWKQTCTCDSGGASPVPCSVLDPFCGAGTSGVVARRLGRSFTGIELSHPYVALAERRISDDAPLLNGTRGDAQ